MNTSTRFRGGLRGFTLIELLIVIAVIGVMSALIVAAITNSTEDTRLVLGRQQQAVVQEALNAWVASQSATNSVASVRDFYNERSSQSERFALVSPYLAPATAEHFAEFSQTNANQPRSEAMAKTGQYLSFPDWQAGSYPRVNMEP